MAHSDLSNVYDFFYPSPITLKELASIQSAYDLWRHEIKKHCINSTLDDLDFKLDLPLSTLIPNIPSVCLAGIKKFFKIAGKSIEYWLEHHIWNKMLKLETLKDFVDFAYDFDGEIHYSRTAKRIMVCDEISDEVKFQIACWNCFEGEIVKLWPSVVPQMDLSKFYTSETRKRYPFVLYWICRLKNQLYRMPRAGTIDDLLYGGFVKYWPALEYFLNSFNPEIRPKKISKFFCHSEAKFSFRYLLQKLEEADLRALMGKRQEFCFLVLTMFECHNGSRTILRICSYIKSLISEEGFIDLVQAFVSRQTYSGAESPSLEDSANLCKIWTDAPKHLKESVISYFLSTTFHPTILRIQKGLRTSFNRFSQIDLFLAIFSDISMEDRKTFWKAHWRLLIIDKHVNDLHRLKDLFFSSKKEFEEFRAAEMSNYENIKAYCQKLLMNARFQHLNEYLTFCCPDEQSNKDIKLKLLDKNIEPTEVLIEKANLLNQFIGDAYGSDVVLANAFKTRLFSHHNKLTTCLKDFIENGRFLQIMQFVNTFAVTEENATDFKQSQIVPLLRSFFTTDFFSNLSAASGNDFPIFMSWLLPNDDKTAQFKQALQVDNIVHNQIRKKIELECMKFSLKFDLNSPYEGSTSTSGLFLNKFLEWYFVTDEALKEFKDRYAEDDVFVRLTGM